MREFVANVGLLAFIYCFGGFAFVFSEGGQPGVTFGLLIGSVAWAIVVKDRRHG